MKSQARIEWGTLTKPSNSPRHRVLYHFPIAFSRSSESHGIHGEKTTVAMWIPNPIIPITQHRLPSAIFVFCLLERSQMSGCNSVFLQRVAMKLQIWKLEDHSLQHLSSDHFTLVFFLVYASLQQTVEIQDLPLNQPVCIKECHDSAHMQLPADHFRSLQLQIDFIASVSN